MEAQAEFLALSKHLKGVFSLWRISSKWSVVSSSPSPDRTIVCLRSETGAIYTLSLQRGFTDEALLANLESALSEKPQP